MKKLFLFLTVLMASFGMLGANYTNATSGFFSQGATWVGGVVPSLSGDTWTITNNTTVIYDVNNSATTGWGNCTNNGTLLMSNNIPCYFKLLGTLTGAGSWQAGNPTNNIGFTNGGPSVTIDLETTNAIQLLLTSANAYQFYGTNSHFGWTTLASNITAGATSFYLSNANFALSSNDVILMQNPNWFSNSTYGCQSPLAGFAFTVASYTNGLVTIQTNWTSATNSWYPTSLTYPVVFYTNVPVNVAAGSYAISPNVPILIWSPNIRSIGAAQDYSASVNWALDGLRFQGVNWIMNNNSFNLNSSFSNVVWSGGCSMGNSGAIAWLNCIECFNAGCGGYGMGSILFSNIIAFKGSEYAAPNNGGNQLVVNCINIHGDYGSYVTGARAPCQVLNCAAYNCGSGVFANTYTSGVLYDNITAINCGLPLFSRSGGANTVCDVIQNGYFSNNVAGLYQGLNALQVIMSQAENVIVRNVTNMVPNQSMFDSISGNVIGFNSNLYLTMTNGGFNYTYTPLGSVNLSTYAPVEWLTQCQDYRIWQNTGAQVTLTNNVYQMNMWQTNRPAVYYIPVTLRPTSTKSVTLSYMQTNNTIYKLYVVQGQLFTPPSFSGADLVFTSAPSTANTYTNFSYTITNPNNFDVPYIIYVTSQAGGLAPATAWSLLTLGPDKVVTKY